MRYSRSVRRNDVSPNRINFDKQSSLTDFTQRSENAFKFGLRAGSGSKSGRITTHYSAAELENLIDAANRVCGENSRKSPALVLLKQKAANA